MIRNYILFVVVGIIMAGVGVGLAIGGADIAKVMAAGGAVLAMAVLPLLEQQLEIRVPLWLRLCYVAFTVGALLLGTIVGLYGIWWPWDGVLHLLSGVLIAGFGIVLLNQRFGKLHVILPVWGRVVLIGMFAASMALLWEIAEFSSDQFLGTFSQQNDLKDTMLDMIYGTGTGILTAVLYYGLQQTSLTKNIKE